MRLSLRASLPRRPRVPRISRDQLNQLGRQLDRDTRQGNTPSYLELSQDYSVRVDINSEGDYDCKVVWYLDEDSDATEILGEFHSTSAFKILEEALMILKAK